MFLYHHWLELPISTRHKIAAMFGIIKKGSTEVFDNTIKSDGYLVKDIETKLTKEAIKAHLESDENEMAILWHDFIKSIK